MMADGRSCSKEARGSRCHVCVVGAGVVGLSTAVRIQQDMPHAQVTILADKFTTQTTSHGAAGIFRPTLEKTPGVPLPLLRQWLGDSWKYLHRLAVSEEAGNAGVCIISGYQFLSNPKQKPFHSEFVFNIRDLTENELNIFPEKYRQGWFYSTLICEGRRYLPYLTRKFREAGGTIIVRKLARLEELAGQYDVIVNCAGLGNQQLTNDKKIIPVRGHIIRVQAPWVQNFMYGDESCYIIPCIDTVVIGGTRQRGDDDITPRDEDHQNILNKAYQLMPSLKNAKILCDWVGLRPHREPIRLESERIPCPGGTLLKVVHNYGHGSEGISLAWGTAMHASRLAQLALMDNAKL